MKRVREREEREREGRGRKGEGGEGSEKGMERRASRILKRACR